jgi:hypothetical protein
LALTDFQRGLIRIIAQNRKAGGESYIAGGAALNTILGAPRLSGDVDLFHDTREAVHRAVRNDRALLDAAGYEIAVEIERDSFVEALVRAGDDDCRLQWAQDSAFRFFPLVEHPELGLALHPFDLATNKVLALVGRAEPRDWVDVIECDLRLQPLGYLAWAAAGKDPGLNPFMILDQAARSARYTEVELTEVDFAGERPTAAALSTRWKQVLDNARAIVALLPRKEVGTCVLNPSCELMRADAHALRTAVADGGVRFHAGCLRGAFPALV